MDDRDKTKDQLVKELTELRQRIVELERSETECKKAFINMMKGTDQANEELKNIHRSFTSAFINALDAKSRWTRGHSERVKEHAILIGEKIGINDKELYTLETAAILHDIGKIGTYDILLDRPDKLTDKEWELIKKHPAVGEEILRPIKGFKDILPIIRHHHERYDGTGYPDQLKGEEIPFFARVLCIADSFDPMVTDRPYRSALGIKGAIAEIRKLSGTIFDPEVADAFLDVLSNRYSYNNFLSRPALTV